MQEKADVLSAFEEFAEKMAEQWKLIAAAIVVVLVALAVMGGWNEMRARRDREATNVLYDAQINARKLVAAKDFEGAEKLLTPVSEQHAGTRAAYEAELQMGDLWMDAGQFEKASGHYEKAARQTGDAFSKLLALYNVGVAQETAGKPAEAVKAYEGALGIQGSDFLRPEILMAEARCYEAMKDNKKAIELYKTVEDKYATRAYYSGAASAFEKQLSAKAQ